MAKYRSELKTFEMNSSCWLVMWNIGIHLSKFRVSIFFYFPIFYKCKNWIKFVRLYSVCLFRNLKKKHIRDIIDLQIASSKEIDYDIFKYGYIKIQNAYMLGPEHTIIWYY